MSTNKDWLSDLQPGDICMYNNSPVDLYEVMSLTHPNGNNYITLRQKRHGNRANDERMFEYEKGSFNRDFTVAFTCQDRQFSYLKSLIQQATLLGDISEVHNLLVKLEI